MSFPKFKPNGRSSIVLILIAAAAILRIIFSCDKNLSVLVNFTPIGAMALFGGASFREKGKALFVPLVTLLFSDLILSMTVYSPYRHGLLYNGWYWTYGAFALMTFTGRAIRQVQVSSVVMAALSCTLIHWIVTDFGVWLEGTLFQKTWAGFMACLEAAVPYELSFLAGTLVYSAILFGGYRYVLLKYPVLTTEK